MEHFESVLQDPVIKGYLKRFPYAEWEEVLKKTLKLGIHSMNTLQSLSLINISPEKNVSIIDIDGCADDSTVVMADYLQKDEKTTPSGFLAKTNQEDSKLPIKKKSPLVP